MDDFSFEVNSPMKCPSLKSLLTLTIVVENGSQAAGGPDTDSAVQILPRVCNTGIYCGNWLSARLRRLSYRYATKARSGRLERGP